MHIKTDLKKASATYKCFVTGMLSSKMMHEIHRAAEEAGEHDRGGTLFHLENIGKKAGMLKDGAPSPGVAALARQVEKKAKNLGAHLSRNKESRLTPEESSMAVAQMNALKESQGRLLKHMAGEACGAPKEK